MQPLLCVYLPVLLRCPDVHVAKVQETKREKKLIWLRASDVKSIGWLIIDESARCYVGEAARMRHGHVIRLLPNLQLEIKRCYELR